MFKLENISVRFRLWRSALVLIYSQGSTIVIVYNSTKHTDGMMGEIVGTVLDLQKIVSPIHSLATRGWLIMLSN